MKSVRVRVLFMYIVGLAACDVMALQLELQREIVPQQDMQPKICLELPSQRSKSRPSPGCDQSRYEIELGKTLSTQVKIRGESTFSDDGGSLYYFSPIQLDYLYIDRARDVRLVVPFVAAPSDSAEINQQINHAYGTRKDRLSVDRLLLMYQQTEALIRREFPAGHLASQTRVPNYKARLLVNYAEIVHLLVTKHSFDPPGEVSHRLDLMADVKTKLIPEALRQLNESRLNEAAGLLASLGGQQFRRWWDGSAIAPETEGYLCLEKIAHASELYKKWASRSLEEQKMVRRVAQITGINILSAATACLDSVSLIKNNYRCVPDFYNRRQDSGEAWFDPFDGPALAYLKKLQDDYQREYTEFKRQPRVSGNGKSSQEETEPSKLDEMARTDLKFISGLLAEQNHCTDSDKKIVRVN